MIDLTNKSVEDTNILIQKYAEVLHVLNLKNISEIQILAITIDEAIKYINDNHKEINVDLKTWCIFVLKQKINKIKTDEDIKKIINNFILYWNNEYQNYYDNLAMFASDFDRDYEFVQNYINEKIGE